MTQPAGDQPPIVVPPGSTPPPGEVKTFTQEEVNAIASAQHARGIKEGERLAVTALTTELGMTIEEITTTAKAAKAQNDALLTQAQRDAAAAAATKAETDTIAAAAKQDRLAAKLERLLTSAKVSETALPVAIKALDVTPESTDEEITKAIADLQKSVPALFAPAPVIPDGDPGARRGGPVTTTPADAGQTEFERRYGAPAGVS